MHFARLCLLIAALTVAGCITAPILSDDEAAMLAATARTESGRFYAALAAASEPECSYEHNMNEYASLHATARRLSARLAQIHASAALLRAAGALVRTIEDSRISHQLASARTDDVNGACMAPGAIALNADAIARASQAIADTQTSGAQ